MCKLTFRACDVLSLNCRQVRICAAGARVTSFASGKIWPTSSESTNAVGREILRLRMEIRTVDRPFHLGGSQLRVVPLAGSAGGMEGHWPEAGWGAQKSGRLRRHMTRMLALVGATSRIWGFPTSTDLGTNSFEFLPGATKVGPTSANIIKIGPNRPGVGDRIRPSLARIDPILARNRKSLARHRRISTNIGPSRPNSASSKLARCRPKLARR